jgi:hypothetical protein
MSLVTAAKNVENLQLNYCVILTDSECDFGNALEGATIKNFDLYYCGANTFSEWPANPHRLEYILKGLGNCKDFTDNLKALNLLCSDLSKDVVLKMTKDSGFENLIPSV